MKIIDIRKRIENISLYKRLAYNSDGFIALIKFLEDENLLDDFWKEFSFSKSDIESTLNISNKVITLDGFFGISNYSFSFRKSKLGEGFWCKKIFDSENYQKIRNKLL